MDWMGMVVIIYNFINLEESGSIERREERITFPFFFYLLPSVLRKMAFFSHISFFNDFFLHFSFLSYFLMC